MQNITGLVLPMHLSSKSLPKEEVNLQRFRLFTAVLGLVWGLRDTTMLLYRQGLDLLTAGLSSMLYSLFRKRGNTFL